MRTIKILVALALMTGVQNVEAAPKAKPCGLMVEFHGDVAIIDASGSKLMETREKAQIPCEAWVSVRDGWAILEHRTGVTLKLSVNTFLQFKDPKSPAGSGESVMLYKGKTHFDIPVGSEEFRVLTANARIRSREGVGVALFSLEDDETQLITVEGEGFIENRYADQARIRVQSGEASSFNYRLKRVVPTTPRALKVASLKEVLDELPLNDDEMRVALVNARERAERPFAVALVRPDQRGKSKASAAQKLREEGRKPASRDARYDRHPVLSRQRAGDLEGYKAWMKHLVRGVDDAERSLLFPGQAVVDGEASRSPGSESPAAKDPAVVFDVKEQKIIDKERERIIQELKKLQVKD